jgi:hypothetical protein
MGDFGFGWSLWVGDGAGAQTRTMWATRSGSVNIDTSLNINGPVYVSLDGAAASSAYRNAFFGSAVANVAPDVIIQDADSSVDRSALEILGGGGTIEIAKFRSNGQTELSGPVTIGSDTQVIGRLSARDRFELYSTNGSEVVLQIQADADDVWMKSPSDLLTIYDIGNKHWIDWDGVNGVSIAFNFNTVFASTANGPELRNGAINILRPADANGNMLMWGKLYTNQDTVETVGLQVKCGEAASAWTRIANFTNSAATIIGGIDIQQGQVPRFSSGSDVRLKENIVDVDQDQYLTKLNAIRIREFDIFENFFKEKKLGRCVGVVAQEYIEVDPGSVMIDPADPFEVQYVGSRDWELIAAVQALSAQVAELKQRLGDEI